MDTREIGDPRQDRAAQTDLARLARSLAAVEQITHVGTWEWDVRSNTVRWSDELYRIYGLEPQSCPITLESFLERVHPQDREHTLASVRTAMAEGALFEYPERILRPDGSVRELDTKGEVIRDASGNVAVLLGTCRDVTDERQRNQTIKLYADIVENIQIGLSVWSVSDPDDISQIRLTAFNPAAERIARVQGAAYIGGSLLDVAPYASGGQLQSLLTMVARDGQVREASVERSRDPRAPNRALAMKAFPLPGNCVGVAIEDVTDALRTRRLRDAEHLVLEMIASGGPLPDILTLLVLAIEEHSPPMLASVLLLDEEGVHLRRGAAPSLPEAYNRAIDGIAIGPKAGSCGTAMYSRQPVYVSDIETDPLWDDYRGIARDHDLRACWSTPILANDRRPLGSLALYYREPKSPAEEELGLIARATRIAGIAIERRQLEDQLRALSGHVEAVREEERTSIAREIHDQLGQSLTALKLELAWLGRRASEVSGVSSEVVLEQVRSMSRMTDETINEVRKISANLRPGVLDDLGLNAALDWQAQEFERRTAIACSVTSNLGDARLDRELSTAVFRIFQEALTNVARHAAASRVEVTLKRRDAWLELEVKDDGKGIALEAAESPKSLGLLGMRERARRLHGKVSVSASAGGGTRLKLRLPLSSVEEIAG